MSIVRFSSIGYTVRATQVVLRQDNKLRNLDVHFPLASP